MGQQIYRLPFYIAEGELTVSSFEINDYLTKFERLFEWNIDASEMLEKHPLENTKYFIEKDLMIKGYTINKGRETLFKILVANQNPMSIKLLSELNGFLSDGSRKFDCVKESNVETILSNEMRKFASEVGFFGININ